MSCGVPWRRSGTAAARRASFSSSVAPARMSVSTTPGLTALTVMPYSAISRASERVRPRMPALAAEYGVLEKTPPPCWADTDDMLTMRPYPCSIICGRYA